MITLAEVRSLINRIGAITMLPEDLRDDSEFVLDSLGLVWLSHLLEERHGLRIDPPDIPADELCSINAVHSYLVHRFPEDTAVEDSHVR